jgi:two-component system sensor histidine kinase SenX3
VNDRGLAWVLARAEYLVLGASLAVIGSLVAWWSVFARRMIDTVHALGAEVAALRGPGDPVAGDRVLDLAARAERLQWMIRGESAAFALALASSVVVLFLLVRRHRQARDRMERLLQFTSHELKTPIAGVRALLQTVAHDRVPADMRGALLADGVAACDRLEHLAETILAYQRAVVAPVTVAPQDARALVEDVLAHRRRSMPEEALDVRLEEARVLAEPDAVRVVLENLLDNARKYGGRHVRVEGRATPTGWDLCVTDDGPGFPTTDAERLFDPFARHAGEGVTHGAGLGLFLSRQLARDLGGELHARSPGPGAGATFTLTLRRVLVA